MRAIALKIHNFRTLDDVEVMLTPYSLLVGINNCGKSNTIDAIRVFYEKDLKYDFDRDFPKFQTTDEESWIEIEFKPSSEELKLLKSNYQTPQGTFRVRKYFKSGSLDSDGKSKTGIYVYIDGVLSNEKFYGAKNTQQGKFGEIIYIPAVSKLDDHTKLTGPSALRELVNSVLKQVLSSSQAYKDLVAAFSEFELGVKAETSQDGQSLEMLENAITKEITRWGTQFELYVNPIAPDDLVKSLINHRLQDTSLGQSQDARSYGQGFQRSLIFALIKLASQYAANSAPSVKKEFSPSLTWLLFEEPEAFLHPSQIVLLDGSLRTLTNSEGNQATITTHNPLFVSRNIEDIPSIVRLCKKTTATAMHQLNSKKIDHIFALNQAEISSWKADGMTVPEDDLNIDMEAIKFALWLNPLRCNIFFAGKALLVEGPTEASLLRYMIDSGQISDPTGHVCVVDCLGKFNIHRFMNLLNEIGVEYSVLYDEDNKKHPYVARSIQAARSLFTIGIDSFPVDLEDFLGVPKSKRPDRKPQHMMWHIHKKAVPDEKMQALASKVCVLLDL
ncbi:MAG: AAA family ATPase [Pseudanabaenaceae cyanobacterium bins.39]|nr:AAA family ATPase [Pseudanabaenaceae cyanobacterium bins.39]